MVFDNVKAIGEGKKTQMCKPVAPGQALTHGGVIGKNGYPVYAIGSVHRLREFHAPGNGKKIIIQHIERIGRADCLPKSQIKSQGYKDLNEYLEAFAKKYGWKSLERPAWRITFKLVEKRGRSPRTW